MKKLCKPGCNTTGQLILRVEAKRLDALDPKTKEEALRALTELLLAAIDGRCKRKEEGDEAR